MIDPSPTVHSIHLHKRRNPLLLFAHLRKERSLVRATDHYMHEKVGKEKVGKGNEMVGDTCPETEEPIPTLTRGFLTRILHLRGNKPHRHDTDHQDTLPRELFTHFL